MNATILMYRRTEDHQWKSYIKVKGLPNHEVGIYHYKKDALDKAVDECHKKGWTIVKVVS